MTSLKKCICTHDFQDKHYGKNIRVHNTIVKNNLEHRCTVCGKETSSKK